MTRLDTHFWWYLSRGSGIVAWAAAALSCALGTLLATRILKPYDRPAWLLALHRHLAALFLAFTATHLVALWLDSYVAFSWREMVIPMASAWKPVAVTYGVVALHVAFIVQATSLARKHLPRALWHSIHLLSYVSFVAVSAHALAAGSDAGAAAFLVAATCLIGLFVVMAFVKALHLKGPRVRQDLPRRDAAAPG